MIQNPLGSLLSNRGKMRIEEGDYLRVAALVVGGAVGSAVVGLMDHPALNQLRSAGLDTIEKRTFFQDASHISVFVIINLWFITFFTGEVTKNYSQVDKLWSMLPPLFAWIYALDAPNNARLTLMAFAVSIWGIRLTLNFYRRGGYTWPPWGGEEDYRWKHVQEFLNAKENVALWKVFHLGFICVYQVLLLFLTCLPFHFVWYADKFQNQNAPLGELDLLAAVVIIGLVSMEALTDEQQYEFQEEKYRLLNEGYTRENLPMPYRQGFLSSGVFAYTRHMNYFCEQSIWFVLNLFIYAATKKELLTPAIGGAVLLSALFQGSIWLQEQTTSDRWPLYKEYIKQVPQLFPYGSGFKSGIAGDEDDE
jgi:steroid 5-alpha reductase family enzyme